jgi:hypothetical protein
MLDYDGRVFRSIANSDGGDVGEQTTFPYHQHGHVVWATYAGGSVVVGTLLAKADAVGNLDMRYQHVSFIGRIPAVDDRSSLVIAAVGAPGRAARRHL